MHATKKSDNTGAESALGVFYVQDTCCMSCGVPQAIAPDLVGWTNENLTQCQWLKQPQTADELDRAIKIIHTQELGCHRYSGKDPAILQRLPAEDCDHIRPDLKLHLPRISLFPAHCRGSHFPHQWNAVYSENWGECYFVNNVGQLSISRSSPPTLHLRRVTLVPLRLPQREPHGHP